MNNPIVKPLIVDDENPECSISFNWAGNPDVQHLLDTISSIIAKEYIAIAKKNPDVFRTEIASPFLADCNDGPFEKEAQ